MLKTHLELCYDLSARKDLEKLNSPHGMLVKRIPSKPVKDITVLWEQPQELLRRYTPSSWVFTNISIKLNLGLDLFIFPQPCFDCNHILIFWLDYIVELNYFQRPERDYGFFLFLEGQIVSLTLLLKFRAGTGIPVKIHPEQIFLSVQSQIQECVILLPKTCESSRRQRTKHWQRLYKGYTPYQVKTLANHFSWIVSKLQIFFSYIQNPMD